MKKVITYGTYDLLHQGHINLLRRAKELGDYLIVGVTNDSFDRERGKLNVRNNVLERVEAVRDTGYADKIIIEDYVGQKIDDIQKYNVDVFAIGSDWRGKFDYLEEFCQVVYLPRTEGISSTMLREKNQKNVRVGILGCGRVAKRFPPEAGFVNGVEIVAAYDIERHKAADYSEKFPGAVAYDGLEAFYDAVDAVYVATPHLSHYKNIKEALLARKHVLCEKPFTINDKQAQELYRLARDRHLFIMEGLWIWFLPLYDRLRSILQQGVIGEIKHISCQYGFVATGARKERKFNPALGGGALLDIGIYNLGFLRIVTGNEPQNVETQKVHINEYGTDDYSCLKLTYNDGCTAESVQTIGQELKRNARIEGTKGSIFLPDFQHAETMILEVEGKEPETIECPVDINGFEYEIREVSRCVKLGYCSSDVYTAKDSIALTRLMYDIRMSWS